MTYSAAGEADAAHPSKRLRALAFYLPQFHPIPENDEWWGRGFTEWTNVAKARPLFRGHYQPHLPADLGFYDLRLPEVRQAQTDLARGAGIEGFCYWHYWFNGRRVLERPFGEVLKSGDPNFPFALAWANENWTRVWDGGEKHVLLAQDYSHEDDRAHLRFLAEAFADPRYIRVDGRPVFLVYRLELLPDPARTAEVWRSEAQALGLGDLYLCRIESHDTRKVPPSAFGFDASIEFQPDRNSLGLPALASLPERIFNRALRPNAGRRRHDAYEYADMVRNASRDRDVPYLRYPCVTPGWDNSPRRARNGRILLGSTPELFEQWLRSVVDSFEPPSPDENLVFVNAWNEWAEGNHLEPDRKWGRQYLEATRRVMATVGAPGPRPESATTSQARATSASSSSPFGRSEEVDL